MRKLQQPLLLSPLEIKWRKLHDRHGRIPYEQMDKLVEHGIFPKKFSELKGKGVMCPSCIFGQMRRRPWRVKGKKSGKIRKEDQKYPGAKVSTD